MGRQKLFYGSIILSFLLAGFAHYFTDNQIFHFVTASIAVVLLAALLGRATESVAHYAGQRLGGFLNATFGNAAELIIGILLLREGLFSMVKASLTGSIIGNVLLVLGLSLFLGGLKYKTQHYNVELASHNASLMMLGVVALFIPAVFIDRQQAFETETLSIVVAIALIIAYVLWLVFSMITHKEELADLDSDPGHGEAMWGKGTSIVLLFVATALVALSSEWLVESVEYVAHTFGWNEIFVGAFLIAIVGNAAEHSAAILLAMKNKMGTTIEIAVGSSLQIALFVAPVLVIVSLFMGNPMDILFSTYEIAAIAVATVIAVFISKDGKTNWFEGVLLILVYIILGTAFFLL